jgi:hypothetical protein
MIGLAQAVSMQGEASKRVQRVLMGADPEQITAARLSRFVAGFRSNVIVWTGNADDVRNDCCRSRGVLQADQARRAHPEYQYGLRKHDALGQMLLLQEQAASASGRS